jgi:hypothetical protein
MRSTPVYGIMLTEYFARNMENKQEIEDELVDDSTKR